NETRYVDKERYFSGGLYNSTSAKLISIVREWYVDEVKYQIYEKFTSGSDMINGEIRKNFSEPDKVMQANRDGAKLLSKGMYLPFGLTMRAYHTDDEGNVYPDEELEAWNESVTLVVNQEPDYLSDNKPHPSNPRLYTLKVRNNNLLGQTGIHVLPTLNPWITTFNLWSIDVEGEFVKFELIDADNEVHPNPIFGHEAQVYVRKQDFGVMDSITGLPIGNNMPIKFNFTTGTFIAVPPGKLIGVGDKNSLNPIEESEGYKVK
ncbi:MAG: hypothetical protein KKI06_03650, partial [Euryarchaeota archaeon]|nr:hypothetical protein [Euryarchaeota archaeon]